MGRRERLSSRLVSPAANFDQPKPSPRVYVHPWQKPATITLEPAAASEEIAIAVAEPAVVKYNQVGVMEMAAEYNLVQCKVIHQDRSYDCTLDSGSCLNLVHWKTVKDFGLADRLVNTSISYKVADGHIAHTMGELPDVELSFGDCAFKITFSVVDRMDHTILLGTSFMHQARCVLSFHKKKPQLYLSDGKGPQSTIPVTYHRSHQWIRSLGSDKRNWPSETSIREEGAPVPRVSMIFPCSKTIEADPPVFTISVVKPAGGEFGNHEPHQA